MGEKCGMHGRDDEYIMSFGSKPERRSPLGKPRCKWEITELHLKRIRRDGIDSIYLAQDRHSSKFSGSRKCGYSRTNQLHEVG
jgi:hypothetical protein